MEVARSVVESRPSRLVHFTPLRYPGGKGKLARYVKSVIETNRLFDGEYVEAYAGGAGIALELLFHEYVSRVHINDISRPIWAFWKCVLEHPEQLIRRVRTTRLTVTNWERQKRVLANPNDHDVLDLGFATFFLNRTNRSGILNGGVIGGKNQTGPWKIDARFNRKELAFRIDQIAKLGSRIRLSKLDALTFLRRGINEWSDRSLIYLDPPYYKKGRDLYLDYYSHEDHLEVANFVCNNVMNQKWIVSYDNVQAIRRMYAGFQSRTYELGYSARETRTGSEIMFFSNSLRPPKLS